MNKNKRQEENKLFGVFFTFPDVRRIGETTALLLDMLDSTVRIAFRKLREDEITTTETCQGEFTRLTKKPTRLLVFRTRKLVVTFPDFPQTINTIHFNCFLFQIRDNFLIKASISRRRVFKKKNKQFPTCEGTCGESDCRLLTGTLDRATPYGSHKITGLTKERERV